MKQQCHISFVYGSWLFAVCGICYYLFERNYLHALLWPVFILFFLWLYVRLFPSLSSYMGYGSMEDRPANHVIPSEIKVILYTGIGCPFCPIVKRRLLGLQSRMLFELREVDVTFKPEMLVSTGIRSLPVIQIGDARWIGNGTSAQLAEFISTHSVRRVEKTEVAA
jgi:glutaredoxin